MSPLIVCLLVDGLKLFPGTSSPLQYAHAEHSFIPTSFKGLTTLTFILSSPSSPHISHSSKLSSAICAPPPCAIALIRPIESDVREVPRRRCEQRREWAVYRRMRRVREEMADWMAVAVGREAR